MKDIWIESITLESDLVTLRPMELSDRAALLEAASDGNLWELWFTSVPREATVDAYMEKAMADKALGAAMPFVIIANTTGKVIGSTRFCNVAADHKRLEIGYTWYAKSYQRTAVNTQCKLLLLGHAFETLGAIAVEFRTHHANKASRTAITRLGAHQDGILRQHMIQTDGNFRHTVVFSILNSEWQGVKERLLYKLRR